MKHSAIQESRALTYLQPSSVLAGEQLKRLLKLHSILFTAREIDRLEQEYTSRGEAFFHVSGAGHEAVAAIEPYLLPQDYLHCHYRDKALMLARGVPIKMFFYSLFCSSQSHSAGRQMSAHMSDPALNILSIVGPVGNHALQAVGVAATLKERATKGIVYCSMGDGTSQQGEVLEAIAEAVRRQLPIIFLVEDNGLSISTLTKRQTFYSRPDGSATEYYGLPIRRVKAFDVLECDDLFARTVHRVRTQSIPELVVMTGERLSDHTNADDQRLYRTDLELSKGKVDDPILHLEQALVTAGIPEKELLESKREISLKVEKEAKEAQADSSPAPVFSASRPLPEKLTDSKHEYRGEPDVADFTMLEAIREVLRSKLATDDRVILYGEDIEDPKGDVFGLTRTLTQQFPGRVINSPLSESTIVGCAIGRALAGQRPVAFLQFADFFPLAFNQIISELGSMYWRTDGGWECPVIVMITCGGYRPGLGPFHAQTMESIAAHIPGVDVMMPSTAGDAAGLLNAAFLSERPTLFFYPKSCLNNRYAGTSKDIEKQLVPLGKARILRTGSDITLVGWGNTVERCEQAAAALAEVGAEAEVIDLRCIHPWDKDLVLRSVERTRRLLVAHEDNHTCGMGGEIISTITENLNGPLRAKRITRADTYVPCNFENQLQILPSFRGILTGACELLDYAIHWEMPEALPPGVEFITALGTSPSDESATIQELFVTPGQIISINDPVCVYEADKAAADLHSSIAGEVLEVLVREGETVPVGTPIIKVKTSYNDVQIAKPVTKEIAGTPHITKKPVVPQLSYQQSSILESRREPIVGIIGIASALGSKTISNEDLLSSFDGKLDADIVRGTGIRSRQWVQDRETVLSLALAASHKALSSLDLMVEDIDLILCSTGTPAEVTPSLACQVLNGLSPSGRECQAVDINAACSGYLYALQYAFDFLASQPKARVLLVTSEVLSPLLNPDDFTTRIIFGDAATATVLGGEGTDRSRFKAVVNRPVLSAQGESGKYLRVPSTGSGETIAMAGGRVFSQGVKKMSQMLRRACKEANLELSELDLVVPHQANQRIIDSIRNHFGLAEGKVFSNIEDLGNTSSSSIPLCLEKLLPFGKSSARIGLTAFGGGFTFGACILTTSGEEV